MTETAMNWGETKGEATSNRVTYMKFNKGRNHVRIVGNILRRYIYWVQNSKGDKLPFENLDFCRETEAFTNSGLNPVKEAGLQSTTFKGDLEFDKEGKPKPLGSKKAYLVPVVNRATSAVEYMELKKGIFDGVNEVMSKLNDPRTKRKYIDPSYAVTNPGAIDIVFNKTGDGLNTEYKVDLIDTMDFVLDEDMFEVLKGAHEADKELLADLKPTEEVFPRKTYQEQKDDLVKHLAGKKKADNKPAPQEPDKSEFKSYDAEAVDDLED